MFLLFGMDGEVMQVSDPTFLKSYHSEPRERRCRAQPNFRKRGLGVIATGAGRTL